MKPIIQPFTNATLRHLWFALACLLLMLVMVAARAITDDISSILDH